jgi:predicted GNAT family N-acyltransferase
VLSKDITYKRAASPAELEGAYTVRRKVFIVEQGIPEDEEYDGLDEQCLHYIALGQGKIIGTARVRFLSKERATIERMAVHKDVRRKGIGTGILKLVEDDLKSRSISEAVLHAQMAAVPFYQSCGFTSSGSTFFEADIEHIKMQKKLGS